jgi:hypothetical protein
MTITDSLRFEMVQVGKRRTKKDTASEAVRESVARRSHLKAIKLFGTVEFHPRYDHKAERKKR